MKKMIAALVAVVALMSGCAALGIKNPQGTPPPPPVPTGVFTTTPDREPPPLGG